jgi:hypothetical protein
MHMDLGTNDELHTLEDPAELITEIPLSCCGILDSESPAKRIGHAWRIEDNPLGDPLACRVEKLLREHAPYPGDDLVSKDTFGRDRFLVYRVSDSHHVIMDRGSHLPEDVEIPSDLLSNLQFFISDWYLKQLSKGTHLPKTWKRCMQERAPMGNAISDQVIALLNAEGRIPGDPSADQFYCQCSRYEDNIIYEVFDRELDFYMWATERFLHNEKLNVSHWYAKHLLKAY